MKTLRKGGFMEAIGEENSFRSKSEAIVGVFNKLDPQVCRNCPLRVFNECGSIPGTAANHQHNPVAETGTIAPADMASS
jgi:SulP family sulfate permease